MSLSRLRATAYLLLFPAHSSSFWQGKSSHWLQKSKPLSSTQHFRNQQLADQCFARSALQPSQCLLSSPHSFTQSNPQTAIIGSRCFLSIFFPSSCVSTKREYRSIIDDTLTPCVKTVSFLTQRLIKNNEQQNPTIT